MGQSQLRPFSCFRFGWGAVFSPDAQLGRRAGRRNFCPEGRVHTSRLLGTAGEGTFSMSPGPIVQHAIC